MKELSLERLHVPADTRKEQPLEMMEGGGKKQMVLDLLQILQKTTDIGEMRKRRRKQLP